MKGGLYPKEGDGSKDQTNDDKYNIPMYKEQINNPMIPNEQKRIYFENKPKDNPNATANQLLNLQLYQPAPPKPKPNQGMKPNPSVFYPNYVPNPYDPMSFANYMQTANYGMGQPNVIKEYNINIGGVTGSHLVTSMLFEDSLPVKNVSGSFCSVNERITMYEAIRSTLFPSGDGKDVPIESESYNLLSHLKLMDMNPYNSSRFSSNPYKGLPFGFLLYRSCYPVRHDTRNATAICSANSTGINVRIYRLTEGGYLVNKQEITKASDYDEWRDVSFYNYIKEHILKKKVCPNFPIMYGYTVSTNSNINFDELKMIQERGRQNLNKNNNDTKNKSSNKWNTYIPPNTTKEAPLQQRTFQGTNQPRFNPHGPNLYIDPADLGYNDYYQPHEQMRSRKIEMSKEQQIIELNKYCGKAIICLTEAANYNILGWAKRNYRADGNVKTMINSGYHTKNVWESVYFQLFVGLYVMQIKGLIINDFKLDRNVFIKDISAGGNVTSYWKYKIKGIEYYIPNYGYLVMIDTNFRDFDQSCDGKETDPTRPRKLDGAFLDKCNMSIDECIQKTFETFRSVLDSNIFGQDFINDNGVKPPEEILNLLSNIKKIADQKPTYDISYYIRQFMTMFLNNRTGGPLTDLEINKVKRGAVKEFHKGQIVVMADQTGIDRFVIFVDKRKNNLARIITKDKLDQTANFIEKEVPVSSLNEFSVTEQIKQNFKMNESNLNEESLLETYNVE